MAKEDKSKQDKPEKKAAPQQQQQAKPKKEQAKKEAAAPKVASGPELPAPPARLAQYYREKVVPDLMQKHGYKTVMQVPRLRKITINMGVGETTTVKKILDNYESDCPGTKANLARMLMHGRLGGSGKMGTCPRLDLPMRIWPPSSPPGSTGRPPRSSWGSPSPRCAR